MLKLESLEIKKLKLLERNPRKITKSDLDKLCDSLINDPGFLSSRPVLVNEVDGIYNVYAGNQRVQAAKKLKWKEITCIIEKDLSEDLMKQRVLKDNKHYGNFDYDILASDYEIDTLIELGFSAEELHLNLDHDDIKSSDDEDKEKKLKCCPACGHEF